MATSAGRPMALLVAAMLLLWASIASAGAEPRIWLLPDLDAYLARQLDGSIVPGERRDERGLVFRLVRQPRKTTPTFVPVPRREVDAMQRLYRWDVEKWLEATHADDLLDGMWAYFADRPFDPKIQEHERAYGYLADWGPLPHPPVRELDLPLDRYFKGFGPRQPVDDAVWFDPAWQHGLDETSGTELTFGNHLKLLANGAAYPEKIRFATHAKKYLFGAIMAIICDDSGETLVDALIARKQAGVDVRLVMEGFYASTFGHACVGRLRDAGVPVVVISDQLRPGAVTAFMHHKFWVMDGDEAIVGGENVIDYETVSNGTNHLNRDEDLLVTGPAVTDFAREFLALWGQYAPPAEADLSPWDAVVASKLRGETLDGVRGSQVYADWLLSDRRDQGVCRVLVQSAGADRQAIAPVMDDYVVASRHQILVTSPTVKFDEKGHRLADDLLRDLRARADAGVDVEVITNGVGGGRGEADIWLNRAAHRLWYQRPVWSWFLSGASKFDHRTGARSVRKFMGRLQGPNLRAWAYFDYMHAKSAVFDRSVVAIGSFNFDPNSADLNHEASIVCIDASLEDELEHQYALDFANSVPLTSSNEGKK